MKKTLSLFLCLCLCISLFSALSFTALAGPGYKVYVNGEAVSSSINVNGGTASVSYDSSTETLTLTLDNCMIGKSYYDGLSTYSVYVSTDVPHFKLELIGYNECASSLRIEDMDDYENGTTLITSGPAKDGELTVRGQFSIEKGDVTVDACKLRLTGEQTNRAYAGYINNGLTIGKPAFKGGSTYDAPVVEVSTDRNIGLIIFGHLNINSGVNTFEAKNYGFICSDWGTETIFNVNGGYTDCSGSKAAALILALKEGCTNLIDFAAGYGETSGNVLSKSAPFNASIGYENAVYFSWMPNGSTEQLTVAGESEQNLMNGTYDTNAVKSCAFGAIPPVFVSFDAGEYGRICGEQTAYQTYGYGKKIGVLPIPVNATFKEGTFNNMYFEGWYVGDTYEGELIDENYVLTSGIQLHALWMEGQGKSFKDVKDSSWFKEAADYCSMMGLISGTGDGSTFSPNMVCSRAMVVSILYRLSGSPYVWSGDNQFSDVKNTWYTDGILWAASNGIVSGIGGGKFAPDASITREQLASIMMRYAAFRGLCDPSSSIMLAGFPDSGKISSWAGNGMSWAVGNGLVSGKPNKTDGRNYLDPQGTATRAEFASILLRYIKATDGALTFFVGDNFRVSVPYLWQGNVVCESFSGTIGDGISFYCKQEHESSGAGRLFGLVFDPDHEYLNLPHFEFYGVMLDSEDNIAYSVVFDLPTDVQCNEDPASALASEYFSMFASRKSICVESDYYRLSFGVG